MLWTSFCGEGSMAYHIAWLQMHVGRHYVPMYCIHYQGFFFLNFQQSLYIFKELYCSCSSPPSFSAHVCSAIWKPLSFFSIILGILKYLPIYLCIGNTIIRGVSCDARWVWNPQLKIAVEVLRRISTFPHGGESVSVLVHVHLHDQLHPLLKGQQKRFVIHERKNEADFPREHQVCCNMNVLLCCLFCSSNIWWIVHSLRF